MKNLFILSALLIPVAAVAEGFMPWTDAMKMADTDGDGTVSMNEVREFAHNREFIGFQPFMADHFIDLDTDGDGTISIEEMKAGMMRMGMSEEEISRGFQQGFAFMPKD